MYIFLFIFSTLFLQASSDTGGKNFSNPFYNEKRTVKVDIKTFLITLRTYGANHWSEMAG